MNRRSFLAAMLATPFARINETSDTEYVYATGARDLYTLGALASPAAVFAVNVVSFAEKTDTTTRQLYNDVRK